MSKMFFDLEDGDFCRPMSNNMAMDTEGNLMTRMGNNMAMDMNSGELHLVSGWDNDDDWF